MKQGMVLKIQKAVPWGGGQPFVSVIIPCYNHGQYLRDAVQSVLDQTWQNFEIIVVNDGSNADETVEILKDFHMPKTRILHLSANMGLPAARNAGIQQAKGKYICCLDADDKLQPTYLEKTIVAMEVNAGLSFVGAWTQVFGNESRVWYTPQFDPGQLIYHNQFSPPTVFKRTAWAQIGGFFEEMREGFEDWEFWVRLTGNGYRGYRISEKIFFYRRVGHSFALRAAEKKDILFEKIKQNNPTVYTNPGDAVEKIEKSYCDIYSPAPFVNLKDQRNYLQVDGLPRMVVSDLDSESTIASLRHQQPHTPMLWVAKHALDENATDLLYQATPYVYILPNFLPWYVHDEFIRHLMKIWNIKTIQKLKK
ncbi:MAG: glycosyltransferase family 2 protein [Anaerolineales bacterium]|uniref:glycosyltransferase family 2 protein n=1 Tax=Candidatus Villigracilis proximus TaxID=3140683 RepID=UPI0031369BDE|nr:glycosyltransferase family 2 protein [Anaerolineales bacterium]